MQECDRIDSVVLAWEQEGSFPSADLAFFRDHCRTCQRCGRKYGSMLALFERDAAAAAASLERPGTEATPPDFTDRVMRRIGRASPRKRLPAPAWAAVAAACVLLIAGAGLFAVRMAGAPGANEVVVRFELDAPGAKSVSLVGSFNGWNKALLPMKEKNRDGLWQVEVRLPRNSVNTYDFVIDGTRWIADPRSPAQVDDGFGGHSSVLRL